jgi:vitamin B12 transporter
MFKIIFHQSYFVLLSLSVFSFELFAVPISSKTSDEIPSHSTYETVVTAARIEQSPEQIADDLSIVNKDILMRAHSDSAIDVLKNINGLQTNNQGGFGQPSSVFIRGANSSHALVLLDGAPLNDPSAPSRAFDFANLSLDEIERIEILRGPESVLYGSDAIGGVIHFITEKPSGPLHFNFDQSFGRYDHIQNKLAVSGAKENLYYSLSTGSNSIKSFPTADEQLGNSLSSPAQAQNLNARVGGRLSDSTQIDFIFRYVDLNVNLDTRGGPSADDPNYVSRTRQAVHRLQTITELYDHFWTVTTQLSYVQIDRNDLNNPDLLNTNFSYDDYHGKIQKYSLLNNLKFSEQENLIFGVESDFESTQAVSLNGSKLTELSIKQNSISSFFAENVWTPSIFFISAGARLDSHSNFGTATTYKIAPGLKFKNTKLRSAFATGFKSPSLYQLYSSFGNPNLLPEQSSNWEIGADQNIANFRLSTTYFNTNYRQLIDYDFTRNQYLNITGADTKGIEAESSFLFNDLSHLKVSYTYLDAINIVTGQSLLRRAHNIWQLEYNKVFDLHFNFLWQSQWISERDDFNPVSFQRETLGGYSLTDVSVGYKFKEKFELYSRIENLFDKIYESIDGFGTARRSVSIGLRGEI